MTAKVGQWTVNIEDKAVELKYNITFKWKDT